MLVFIIIFILLIYGVQKWHCRHALKNINYDYTFSKQLLERGEAFKLVSTITNESRRFIPFIRMEETLPQGIKPKKEKVELQEDALGFLIYSSSIYLSPRSQLNRKLELTFPKRGCYEFFGATLHGGDFFGMQEQKRKFEKNLEIIVYPNEMESAKLQEIMGGFLGDMSVRRFIMEDPILTVGAYEYTGREPMKQISWKQTARSQQMMVKRYDYTTELKVTVLLDVSGMTNNTTEPQDYENCYAIARSVCQHLLKKDIAFDFLSNAAANTHLKKVGKSQLKAILEHLGRGGHKAYETFEALVEKVLLEPNPQRSILVISPKRDEEKIQLANSLQKGQTTAVALIWGEDYDDVDLAA